MEQVKKRDVIFISCLLAVGLLSLIGWKLTHKGSGQVEITVADQVYGQYSLEQDQEVSIKNMDGDVTNVLVIRKGKAFMDEADCPDHLCEKQGKIFHNGETIVCLPNKVVVSVVNGSQSQYDSVTQ